MRRLGDVRCVTGSRLTVEGETAVCIAGREGVGWAGLRYIVGAGSALVLASSMACLSSLGWLHNVVSRLHLRPARNHRSHAQTERCQVRDRVALTIQGATAVCIAGGDGSVHCKQTEGREVSWDEVVLCRRPKPRTGYPLTWRVTVSLLVTVQ